VTGPASEAQPHDTHPFAGRRAKRLRALLALAVIGFGYAALLWLTGAGTGDSSWEDFIVHDAPRPVVDIAFVDQADTQQTIPTFRGKVVLLNIWATWCAPCRREMPTLDRLQARLCSSDFEVVALSIDRVGSGAVRAFYDEIGVRHLASYLDRSGKSQHDLGVFGIPTMLLIDRDGREVARLIGPAEWTRPP
jgi:thiol-disulfide isomerase/thioredoxin